MPKHNFHASRPLKSAKNLKFGIKNANIPTLIIALNSGRSRPFKVGLAKNTRKSLE